MKTVLLFHRLELTEMYAPLSKELAKDFKIVHLAYSEIEKDQLLKHGIDAPVIIFKDEIQKILNKNETKNESHIGKIDESIIEHSEGEFNLNSAMQNDRGFGFLSYRENILLSVAYYEFWDNFILHSKIDYVIHEPISLMMNFLCAVICKKYKAEYLSHIMRQGSNNEMCYFTISGFYLTSIALEHEYHNYTQKNKQIDSEKCDAFLKHFNNDMSIFLQNSFPLMPSKIMLLLKSIRNKLKQLLFHSRHERIVDCLERFHLSSDLGGEYLRNRIQYSIKLRFQDFIADEPFYYYPIHLEPEAVVLYQAGGIYVNQVKLIQNIAGQLPPETLLYVKDHPHQFGYRTVEDYEALQKIRNIRLIKHSMPGKLLIKHSIGVITINGTAGFEALLMGKQVYTFGKVFYGLSPRVKYIKNIRDLRDALYINRDVVYSDDSDLKQFVAAYLDALNVGMVDFFAGRSTRYDINRDKNIKQIAHDFRRYVSEYPMSKLPN